MKLIREGRFGPPKAFKTGAIVGTYPKPMLVLEYNEGGLDVIPTTAEPVQKDRIKVDCLQSDITYIEPGQLGVWCAKKPTDLPKVTCIDFSRLKNYEVTASYGFQPYKDAFQLMIDTINNLRKVGCPWKTTVIDPADDLTELIISHMTATNRAAMETKGTINPQRWAPMAAGKLRQIISFMHGLPAHSVVIIHDTLKEVEQTGEIKIQPMIVSQFRDKFGADFSQFLYATKEADRPVVLTTDKGFVKGVGCRWPANLPAVCGADFQSIYGKELLI